MRSVELLVLEDRSGELTLGVHIELAPGWYLYWLNPGDAGLAPQVRWLLPAGFAAGRLRFPTPQKFVHGGITTYGFKDETLILCDIRRAAESEPASAATEKPVITALLDWMACRESCLTGKTTVRVEFSKLSSAETQKAGRVFSRFSPRYPKSASAAGLAANEGRLLKSPGGWRIETEISGRDAAKASDFYPYPLEDFVIEYHRIAVAEGKLTIPVAPSHPAAVLSGVSGLLIVAGTGFELSIPVKD